MLNLVLGRAGTGKTAYVMDDIRRRMEAGESDLLLIVPEQYSHGAERQLSAVCGDRLSLHGETLSFTGLCGRVFSEKGSAQPQYLDIGGQILVMHRAFESVASKLKAYGMRGQRAEVLEKLLGSLKEFKSYSISLDMLAAAAEGASGVLADKLHDLVLIFSAYEGLMGERENDPMDRLTLLGDMIGGSALGNGGHIYFDGFNDFTLQEFRIIEELLIKNADLTVCLTYDPNSDSEVFNLPRKTSEKLRRFAVTYGTGVKETVMESVDGRLGLLTQAPNELMFLEKHLFGYDAAEYQGQCKAITIYSARSMYTECEYAASKIWELVRAGYRWRDIGVMARDWEEYRPICENVFEKYGVPYFSAGRADAADKPPVALIGAALEIAVFGWEYRSALSYLKTGLAGVSAEGCSELENYVLTWNIRGFMWEQVWKLPHSGYGGEIDEEVLVRLNDLRRRTVEPIIRLRKGIKGVTPIGEKLRALYEFFDEIRLPEHLIKKAERLEKLGETRLADEYTQIWDVVINAMEQMYERLGGTQADAAEFRKLLMLVISQYDIGVIPTSLDKTALGSLATSRRRDLKCLIVLGTTDDKFPMTVKSSGALSDSEREELISLGLNVPAGIMQRLDREMNMIYSTLTLPSSQLVLTYPKGGGRRPSFIIKRIKTLFDIAEESPCEEEYMTAAEAPCFEYALMGHGDGSAVPLVGQQNRPRVPNNAAREYFEAYSPEVARRLAAAERMLREGRGRLSASSAGRLYRERLSLSPSRVDKYYSCPYQHFLHSGLRLAPRVRAAFDAPQAGTFMHFVLEGVAREVKDGVGYKNADDELCRELTDRYIERYVRETLHGFEGKNARFVYLFKRLEENVTRIALDMLEELKRSDFEPLAFELELAKPHEQGISGIIDRVDGWEHNGKRYIRVIDYKTGRKSFSLTDVLHGRDLQMLIYLFALQKYGKEMYGSEVAPAGVLYVPARDVILKAPRNVSKEELDKKRVKELRRSGLILNDPIVIDAMENGGTKQFLPVKYTKSGEITGDSLVSMEQTTRLDRHVRRMLDLAAEEILGGEIRCVPYYKSESDNACLFCKYRTVCGFDEDSGDRPRYIYNMKASEIWAAMAGFANSEFGKRNAE